MIEQRGIDLSEADRLIAEAEFINTEPLAGEMPMAVAVRQARAQWLMLRAQALLLRHELRQR